MANINKLKLLDFLMIWRKLSSWKKGLIIGVVVCIVGTFLMPLLVFLGFFGSWLNFSQYSLLGLVNNIAENFALSWIIILTISILIGLFFDYLKTKNKKLIIPVVILLIFLVIEIFSFGSAWKDSGLWQTWSTLQDCPGLKSLEKKDSCYLNFALEKNDSSLCNNLSGSYIGHTTSYCLARITKDSSYCNKFSNNDDKDQCFQAISQDFLNRSLCNHVTNSDIKSGCFTGFDYFVAINGINITK